MNKKQQHEFFKLAGIWLACRLAVFGGTPLHPPHIPVTDFKSLCWALLGCHDYALEMHLLCEEIRNQK